MLKIRLARRGRKQAPFYHIVVADARSPRDGKFVEKIGSYNPMTNPATVQLDIETAIKWLDCGAQPTDTARNLLKSKGVLFARFLSKGVKKGVLTQEQADTKLADYITKNEAKIEKARLTHLEKIASLHKNINGQPIKKANIEVAPATEALEEFQINTEESTELNTEG